jgi:hypothetical protein
MVMASPIMVGRSLAYVDAAFNAYNKTRTGRFGAFECVNDPADGPDLAVLSALGAEALLQEARA